MVPCRCCSDTLARETRDRAERYLANQGATPEMTFRTFDRSVTGVEAAFEAAWMLAEGRSSFIWLLIYGGTGNGKSHLCAAIARRAMERGRDVKITLWADLVSDLKKRMENNTVELEVQRVKDVFLLVIDEFGLEYGSNWELAKFDEIMTHRFRDMRPTVVATNLDIMQLPERARSRFQDRQMSRAVLNKAQDYRRIKHAKT